MVLSSLSQKPFEQNGICEKEEDEKREREKRENHIFSFGYNDKNFFFLKNARPNLDKQFMAREVINTVAIYKERERVR